MINDLAPELGRRKRAAWGAYESIEDVVKKTKNIKLRAHLFNTTVLPALTYASETWALRKQDENAVSVMERSIEKVMLGVTCLTQVRAGILSSTLRQQSKIRDAAVYVKLSKIRWAGHVMRLNGHRLTRAVSDWTSRNVKRTKGRTPTDDGQTSSRSPLKDNMMLFVPLERTERIRPPWHVRGTNGRVYDLQYETYFSVVRFSPPNVDERTCIS
ncbi:hypothetical protein Y032_0009g598 [Ancylostoma ceylanicum]|uniref:Reverse transcriptase domain-containing protein n=1 Tax=Ancylostoma ceylanicum TaxID=53326 RepID=A0A016VHZ4_9BILA|nr:hypothetical protein Y032_0009g598 [Ancylostoma ceylanicum]